VHEAVPGSADAALPGKLPSAPCLSDLRTLPRYLE